jgi:hypothetical protein
MIHIWWRYELICVQSLPLPNRSTTGATPISAISPSILRTIIFPERPHSRRQFLPINAPIGGYLVDIQANIPAFPSLPGTTIISVPIYITDSRFIRR